MKILKKRFYGVSLAFMQTSKHIENIAYNPLFSRH